MKISLSLFSIAAAAVASVAVTAAPVAAAPGVGVIKGHILFEGEPPERAAVVRDSDPYCKKTPKVSEDIIVTKGKLKDVLVRIQNGTAGTHATPAAPVVLDQRECMYTPRVVGLVGEQKLVARNSDGTFHNVHGTIGSTQLWNRPHAAKGADLSLDTKPKAKAGDVIDVKCDVHPWMHAYAIVQDHPFFAVTGDDGTFEIKGLQPGTYTLEAWHPTLGAKSMQVKIGVAAKASVSARFSYKASER